MAHLHGLAGFWSETIYVQEANTQTHLFKDTLIQCFLSALAYHFPVI